MKSKLLFFLAVFVSITAQAQKEKNVKSSVVTGPVKADDGAPVSIGTIATSVKNQKKSETCWAFSTASFMESEAIRKNLGMFDISEMFIVRNIYIEKAKNYVLRQGKAQFSEGALGHDMIRALGDYGAVPENVYAGVGDDDNDYTHNIFVKDLQNFLDTLLAHQPVATDWLKNYEAILNKKMGIPPSTFIYKGKTYTPLSYAKEILRVNANDYVNITSFLHHPFNQSFVLEVPDNFSNGNYYNLPLNEMLAVIKNTLNAGYTIEWDADVSNPGFRMEKGRAMFTAMFSPGKLKQNDWSGMEEDSFSDTARQRLFEQLITTDDHLMHIVSMEKDNTGKVWFNVKNSWGEVGPFKGYIKVSEAYIAMNTIGIVVPRVALSKALQEKIKPQY